MTKEDILAYVENRGGKQPKSTGKDQKSGAVSDQSAASGSVSVNGKDEIIEMSRMGKMIAKHMVASVQTAAHVQSFIEVDVTNIWNWRNKVKTIL